MIKTLFASASTLAYAGCIAICCMGNEYPAKAYGFHCKGDAACMNAAQNRQIDMDNMRREMEYQRDREMEALRREMQQRSY